MSTGMKQKVSIARAIVHDPPVLIFDEATAGLDVLVARALLKTVVELRDHGKCVVLSTHIMREAEKLCDRIAIIDHGRIIALGTKEELVRDAFASRSEMLARFGNADERVDAWVRQRGGLFENGMARFTIEHATEIAGLLDAADKAGHDLIDVSLRKPNLESVFLHLTGRELRD